MNAGNRKLRTLLLVVPIGVLVCAEVEVIRQVYADSLAQHGAWEQALSIEPWNADRFAGYAMARERAGASPVESLLRAAALSPRDSAYRTRLGLAAEAEGDFATAERELLAAASFSRKFEPRWNLANFYFRRERWEPFWESIAAALPISYGDRSTLFDLCWRSGSDARERLGRMLPADRGLRSSYAHFLFARQEPDLAATYVVELAAQAEPSEREMFRSWCDRLLHSFKTREAVTVWNLLKARGLVTQDAFPWQTASARDAGVTCVRAGEGWRIELSGHQPEHIELLSKVAPVTPGRTYQFEWDIEARLTTPSGEPTASGVAFRVETFAPAPINIGSSDDIPAGPSTGSLRFAIPAAVNTVRFVLEYRRPLGEVRAEGTLHIKRAAV